VADPADLGEITVGGDAQFHPGSLPPRARAGMGMNTQSGRVADIRR
jgi:hypothetical protein